MSKCSIRSAAKALQAVLLTKPAREKSGDLKVGTEYEMFGYTRDGLRPLHYAHPDDPNGPSIKSLLEASVGRLGWKRLTDGLALIGMCCSEYRYPSPVPSCLGYQYP